MTAQFWTAIASSLASLGIVAMLRQLVKARKVLQILAGEHRFLMYSMRLVLQHLDLEGATPASWWEEGSKRATPNRSGRRKNGNR